PSSPPALINFLDSNNLRPTMDIWCPKERKNGHQALRPASTFRQKLGRPPRMVFHKAGDTSKPYHHMRPRGSRAQGQVQLDDDANSEKFEDDTLISSTAEPFRGPMIQVTSFESRRPITCP